MQSHRTGSKKPMLQLASGRDHPKILQCSSRTESRVAAHSCIICLQVARKNKSYEQVSKKPPGEDCAAETVHCKHQFCPVTANRPRCAEIPSRPSAYAVFESSTKVYTAAQTKLNGILRDSDSVSEVSQKLRGAVDDVNEKGLDQSWKIPLSRSGPRCTTSTRA